MTVKELLSLVLKELDFYPRDSWVDFVFIAITHILN